MRQRWPSSDSVGQTRARYAFSPNHVCGNFSCIQDNWCDYSTAARRPWACGVVVFFDWGRVFRTYADVGGHPELLACASCILECDNESDGNEVPVFTERKKYRCTAPVHQIVEIARACQSDGHFLVLWFSRALANGTNEDARSREFVRL